MVDGPFGTLVVAHVSCLAAEPQIIDVRAHSRVIGPICAYQNYAPAKSGASRLERER